MGTKVLSAAGIRGILAPSEEGLNGFTFLFFCYCPVLLVMVKEVDHWLVVHPLRSASSTP